MGGSVYNEVYINGTLLPSFFQEYKRKLEGLYDRFYTRRGAELALQRRQAAVSFYENLRREMSEAYQMGGSLLAERLE